MTIFGVIVGVCVGVCVGVDMGVVGQEGTFVFMGGSLMLSELHLRVCGVGVRCCMARRHFSLYGWAALRPVDCICECVVWVFGV